ncbi:MAG: hypothetical protein MMC33_010831 [Icmadophila ericetorum]|nr:hypothetical protein [Icmadophila ericetorum]
MSEEPQLQQRKVQISNSMAAKQESLGFEIANPNHQALQIGLLRGTPHVACPSPFTALTPKFKNSFASTNSPLAKENSNLFDLTASPNETTIITNPANIIESQMTQVKNGANGNVVRLLPTSRKRRADEQLNVTPKRTQSAPPYAFSGSVLLFRQFEDGQVLPVITGVRCAVFRRRKLLYPKFYDADGKLLFEETRTGLYITRPGDNIVRCSKIESGIPVWEAETPNTSAA